MVINENWIRSQHQLESFFPDLHIFPMKKDEILFKAINFPKKHNDVEKCLECEQYVIWRGNKLLELGQQFSTYGKIGQYPIRKHIKNL